MGWWIERLNAEGSEEEYAMIGIHPKGCIDKAGSDITLNRWMCNISSDILYSYPILGQG